MNQETRSSATATVESATPIEPSPARPSRTATWIVIALLAAAAAAGIVFALRSRSNAPLATGPAILPAPTVNVKPAQPGASSNSIVLPGNVTAFSETPVYANTNGYLERWYYDIGAHVTKGALLATISAPEVDRQLSQAEADLATAEATANNAHIQAERYSSLVTADAVSQQQTDDFVNQAAATAATVRAAQANVARLKTLQGYEKVYAPFTGIVTARNVDIGQLVAQGTGAELFHLQETDILRVYTNVPQVDAQTVRRGMQAAITFPDRPGRTFTGTIVRTADAIDPVSRTLLVEIDVKNPTGTLFPGELAQVHLKAPAVTQRFIVPSAAVIFRKDGLRVGVVTNGDIAHLVPVLIGEDDGATVQLVSGLHAGDLVIQDPPDSLTDGEKVTVARGPGNGEANNSKGPR